MFKKYDNLSNKLFAKFYDSLNSLVEWRLKDLRISICDQAIGDVLEIGGGTGANLKYFSQCVLDKTPHSQMAFIVT